MKAINFFKTSNIWIVLQYFLQYNIERLNKMYKLLYYIMLYLPWLLILSCVANPEPLLWQIETFHFVPMFVQECSIASLKMIFHHLLFHLPQLCFHAYEPIFYSLQFSQDSGKDKIKTHRGGAAYLYLISTLIWPHFDTYPYISIQNILMSTQNILITKIYLWRGFLSKNIQRGDP